MKAHTAVGKVAGSTVAVTTTALRLGLSTGATAWRVAGLVRHLGTGAAPGRDGEGDAASTRSPSPARRVAATPDAPTPDAPTPDAPAPRTVTAEDLPPVVLPSQPPVDVVGAALDADGSREGAGRATEPRAASREEDHGEAALQRTEADEIDLERVEATPAGRVGVVTPVGTTGADTGWNPDTAEAGLDQPGTPPLLDPSLTKQVRAEAELGRAAADPGTA